MDPLSITLAVVTLATALKDIIETAEKIQDSFSKLPQNYRNAKQLAEEVLETLQGMEEIYQEHEQTFNKTKSLKKAISKLQKEMKAAHEQCTRLVPPVSERKRDRFRTACYSFWSRDKVERLLSELKDHVDRCSQQFHLLSSFQTDALVIEIHDTIVQSTSHSSTVIHSHTSLGGTSMSYSGLGNRTNSQLCAFTQSNPMQMTWIADTIPSRDLSTAYLRREVGRVDLFLQSILSRWSQTPMADMEIPPLNAITEFISPLPASTTVIHQHAVVHAFRMQSLLQGSKSNQWLKDVNHMLLDFSVHLEDLRMLEDTVAIRTSMVSFWRRITRSHPSPTSSRHLARALTNLARALSNARNRSQAYAKREEAIEILRSLAAHETIMESNKQDIQLIAENRIRQAEDELSERSLRLALDGHDMFEGAFKLELTDLRSGTICFAPNVSFPFSRQAITPSSLDSELENPEISEDDWHMYASGLLSIARTHNRFKLYQSSHKLAKLALTILNHLFAKHPSSRILYIRLEHTLALLLDNPTGATRSQAIAQKLEYLQQYVAVLRRLAPFKPQFYVKRLTRALWSQREVLIILGRAAEAQSAYEDIIGLKDLAAASVHSDLQVPSETEGEYYAQLASYHYLAARFTDAIYAAQNSISQYTALEFIYPGQSRTKHINALALLCKSLSAMHQYDTALSEGYKAIKMIENSNIYGPESHLIVTYGDVSNVMMNALESSSHPEALTQASDLNARILKLVRSRELKFRSKLAPALIQYADLLQKKGRVEEAVTHLQEVLNGWREMFEDLKDTMATELYIKSLLDISQTLDEHGEVEKGLRYKEEARLLIVGNTW